MKKIKSYSDIKNKERRNKIIVGVILIVLLVFSTAGYALNGIYGNGNSDNADSDQPTYNGQYWIYPLGGQNYYFINSRDDVDLNSMNIDVKLNKFIGKNLYIDSENELVLNIIGTNLGRFASKIQEACYGKCERDLPEKDCSNEIIIFKESEIENIRSEEGCVFIEGNLKTVDGFLYRVLGFN